MALVASDFDFAIAISDGFTTFSDIDMPHPEDLLDHGISLQKNTYGTAQDPFFLQNTGDAVQESTTKMQPLSRVKAASYSQSKWAEMRPIIEDLYIGQGMKLQKVMRKLASEYDFFATEQMYKKRLRVWGMRRYMSAAEKDSILDNNARNETLIINAVGPDNREQRKIIRRARDRVTEGTLDRHVLDRLSYENRSSIAVTSGRFKRAAAPLGDYHDSSKAFLQAKSLPRSPTLPQPLADTETVFKSLRDLMKIELKLCTHWRVTLDNKIIVPFYRGLLLWHSKGFKEAQKCFTEAAIEAVNLLTSGRLQITFIVQILFFSLSDKYGKFRLDFITFLAKWMKEAGSPHSRLIKLLECWLRLQHGRDFYASASACINESCTISQHNVAIWKQVLISECNWCLVSREYELGMRLCEQAIQMTERFSPEDIGFLVDVRITRATFIYRQGELSLAKAACLSVINDIDQVSDKEQALQYSRSGAYELLAWVLLEQGEILMACEYMAQVVRVYCANLASSSVAMAELGDLLRFCNQFGLTEEAERYKEEFFETYTYLEEITEGLWNIELEDS